MQGNNSVDKKVERFGELLGVGKRQAYNYLAGDGMTINRAKIASARLGGHLMVWLDEGEAMVKRALFDRADI